MALTFGDIKRLYESHTASPASAGAGRQHFITAIRHGLGLCDGNGRDYRDLIGNRKILRESTKFQPEHFSLRDLALAIIGPEYATVFNPDNPYSMSPFRNYNSVQEAAGVTGRGLLEATGAGVDVSNFSNINAWTGVVGGLIERKILDSFENADFIGDDLMPDEPTKVAEGQKFIAVSRLGDVAEERQPGERHRRAGVGERYVTSQKSRENALAVDVLKESVFFDLTGEVLAKAGEAGAWVGFRKEFDKLDAFLGITTAFSSPGTTGNTSLTNSSTGKYKWTYKGTSYAFYTGTGGITIPPGTAVNLTNQQSNELLDWTALQTSWLSFMRFVDPETNTRVGIFPDTILVNPAKMAVAELVCLPGEVERRAAPGSTQSGAVTLNITQGSNPAKRFGVSKILVSPYAEQRCTDATGLGLAQSSADKLWIHFRRGLPFRYLSCWPMSVTQAPANSYEMLDRGICATWFASERGYPVAISPWGAVLNTF